MLLLRGRCHRGSYVPTVCLAMVLLWTVLNPPDAAACEYSAPNRGFNAGQAAGAVAMSLAAHSLSAVVLYKLYYETEPEGKVTVGWHLAGVAALAGQFVLGLRGSLGCGPDYVDREIWPVLGRGHAVGLVATLALPIFLAYSSVVQAKLVAFGRFCAHGGAVV